MSFVTRRHRGSTGEQHVQIVGGLGRDTANCQFLTGITRVREGALRFRIALLYAEKEPLEEKN